MSGQRFQLARGLAVPKKGPSSSLGYSVASTVSATMSPAAVAVMLTATSDIYMNINTTASTATGHLMIAAHGPQVWDVIGGKDVVHFIMQSVQGKVGITELVAPNDV